MPKIPDCDRCLLCAKSPHLVCAVHPSGVDTSTCPDFRADPNVEQSEELWSPEGYYWYGEELIPYRQRLTQEERIHIYETHPFFTGVCPRCGYNNFDSNNPPRYWDCPQCGWIDNRTRH